MPAQDLRGFAERVALVTGAGSGIGRAVSLQLALQGAYVVAVLSPAAAADAIRAVEELRAIGTLAHVIEADVTTPFGAEMAIAEVNGIYGRLDFLINALQVEEANGVTGSEAEIWEAVIGATLNSALWCTRQAAPLMRGRPSPAVVSVACPSGFEGPGSDVAFGTAAAGLTGMTRALACELAPGIRVNCVVATDSPARTGAVANPVAANRTTAAGSVAANEVARSVVFLLSSDAKAISGQTLTVGPVLPRQNKSKQLLDRSA